MGNPGTFRFGEFAVAGTTRSSVVSVLRAQHQGWVSIHMRSSPRISPEAWKLSWDLESRAFVAGCWVLLVWDVMWCSGKLRGAGGWKGRSFPRHGEDVPGPFCKSWLLGSKAIAAGSRLEGDVEIKRLWKAGVRAELCFTHSVIARIIH